MPDINITVAHKVAVSDTQAIVCDNSDYTVHWTLDEDWSAYDTKTMRTIYMDGTFTDKVFSGAEVELPVCTVPGVVQIGLFENLIVFFANFVFTHVNLNLSFAVLDVRKTNFTFTTFCHQTSRDCCMQVFFV